MRTVRRARMAESTAIEPGETDTSPMGSATSDETTDPEADKAAPEARRKEATTSSRKARRQAAKEAKAQRKAQRRAEKKAQRAEKKGQKKRAQQKKSEPADTAPASRPGPEHPGQVRSLVMAAHPRTALAVAVVVAVLVALMGRDAREVAVSGAAVLVTQLLLGIMNDLFDREDDAASLAPRKPIASGWLPPGNASFAIAVLLLLALPLALQNSPKAGAFVLATVPVGYLHNRWLHRMPLSWVGWSATYALLACFVTLGGWGAETSGTWPQTSFVVLSAVLGLVVHFLTTLPDLVSDNRAQVKSLPLRVALRLGATKLLVLSVLCALVVVGLLVYYALSVGIAR